jgi:hypothetical protein
MDFNGPTIVAASRHTSREAELKLDFKVDDSDARDRSGHFNNQFAMLGNRSYGGNRIIFSAPIREELFSIVSNPDKFTGASPYTFLIASLLVLIFGPGKASMDALLAARAGPGDVRPTVDGGAHASYSIERTRPGESMKRRTLTEPLRNVAMQSAPRKSPVTA